MAELEEVTIIEFPEGFFFFPVHSAFCEKKKNLHRDLDFEKYSRIPKCRKFLVANSSAC